MEQSVLDIIKSHLSRIHKQNTLFVTSAIIITSIFTVASFIIPHKYKAKSTVFIESNVIGDLVSGIAVSPSMDDRLSVLSHSIKSRNLLLQVIKDLDIDMKIEDQAGIEKLVRRLQNNTDIDTETAKKRSSRKMNLFTVSFKHTDPTFARDYVNTLVRLYIEENLSEKRNEAYGAKTFLAEQIEYFNDKLEKIEKEIVAFRTEKGVFVSVNEGKIVEEIKDAEEKLEELQVTKMELKAKEDALNKDMKKESLYTVVIPGSGGNTIGERIMILQSKLNELLMNYTNNYPEVVRIKAEIEALNRKLEEGIHNDTQYSAGAESEVSALNPVFQDIREELSKISYEFAALEVRENYIKKRIETKKGYLREIPAEKKKLADLEDEKFSNKKIYEELILRLGQSEVSSQMEIQDKGATFRIVDPAVLPRFPVSPNRVKIILIGIFAGIAGAFWLVLLIDKMDHSVKSVNTLKNLRVPILGIIPKIQISEEVTRRRKKDRTIYTIASFYVLFILGVFVRELINKFIG
jgi:polysaccharide chain length determinant protein (PEP-CTERM system associated)